MTLKPSMLSKEDALKWIISILRVHPQDSVDWILREVLKEIILEFEYSGSKYDPR